ncbi:MAG: hypothetical protein AAF545_01225 [Pseudomonadota bacterium]
MNRLVLPLIASLLAGCGGSDAPDAASTEPEIRTTDDMARDYVVLELAMGIHDRAHVDAYFGPEALRDVAESKGWTPDDIDAGAAALAAELSAHDDQDGAKRIQGLLERLTALRTRLQILKGEPPSFDDEARKLFGAAAPDYDDAHFAAILADIDVLLPGDAPLAERVNTFKDQFNIPPDRLGAVFSAAMDECRVRTLQQIELPDEESFTIEYVSDKPWSGYNWYQGNAVSLIQVNTDLPTAIDRAVDLGCHEGYPGHHTYNALLERELAQGEGWVEYTLYPLFSPQSLIAEGTANYGIELAFPGEERIAFERDVLFPLAGLDATEADTYYALQRLLGRLNYAGNEAARDYLNGDATREETEAWLVKYALSSPERAAQRIRFIETYRSYVINYNLGKDLVAEYIERDDADTATRWQRFERILSEPFSPADLK